MVFGGEVIGYWEANYTAETAPLGLTGWHATYVAFGIPGILLAILTWLTVREPVRGRIDGLPTAGDPDPMRSVLAVFAAMLPPWKWRGFAARDASRKRSSSTSRGWRRSASARCSSASASGPMSSGW